MSVNLLIKNAINVIPNTQKCQYLCIPVAISHNFNVMFYGNETSRVSHSMPIKEANF